MGYKASPSVLAWRIPGMGEPGGLLSTGSHRVRHDWSDLAVAAAACKIGTLYHLHFTDEESEIERISYLSEAAELVSDSTPNRLTMAYYAISQYPVLPFTGPHVK